MIRIRDEEGVVLAAGHDPSIVTDRCTRERLQRVDIWPRDSAPTTVGVTWSDGSFALMDWADQTRARAWIAGLPGAAGEGVLREHGGAR